MYTSRYEVVFAVTIAVTFVDKIAVIFAGVFAVIFTLYLPTDLRSLLVVAFAVISPCTLAVTFSVATRTIVEPNQVPPARGSISQLPCRPAPAY